MIHNSAPNGAKVQTNIPTQQLVNLTQGAGTNPQAYDELKKRLLSEYKKLTKQKGTAAFDENQNRVA
jgi:hypothetical protein